MSSVKEDDLIDKKQNVVSEVMGGIRTSGTIHGVGADNPIFFRTDIFTDNFADCYNNVKSFNKFSN